MATTEGESVMVKFVKDVYSFIQFDGFGNCNRCDDDTMINSYRRHDGAVIVFCKKCEDRLGL
jgi:hypothetical protein